MTDAWSCLTTVFLSVCWACGSSTGRLSAHLNHRHLSFCSLDLWDLVLHRHGNTKDLVDVLDLWQLPGLLARLSRTHFPLITTGIPVVTQRSSGSPGWRALSLHKVDDLNSLRDLLDVRHLSLCHRRNDRRCLLHSWSVHHSVALPGPESVASSLFAVELGLLELVRKITVSSTRFSEDWACVIKLSSELSAVTTTFSSVYCN